MAIHNNTSYLHLSYQEIDSYLRNLSNQLHSKGCTAIYPVSTQDTVITALLSELSGLPMIQGKSTWLFGLTSEVDTDICIFKKNYTSDFYNRTVKCYVDEIYQEEDESFAKITLPWRK